MKNYLNKNHEIIITLLLFGLLFIGVAAIAALFGGTVMKLFGFEYRSVGSVILFFLIASIISYPIILITETLPKVLLTYGRLSKTYAILLYIILNTIAIFTCLYFVDYFMNSVSAANISILAAAFLFSLAGIGDIGKKPDGVD